MPRLLQCVLLYTFEPIVVAGRFTVLKDDSAGLLYRLSDAAQVEVAKISPGAAGMVVPPGTTPQSLPLR